MSIVESKIVVDGYTCRCKHPSPLPTTARLISRVSLTSNLMTNYFYQFQQLIKRDNNQSPIYNSYSEL